MPKAYEFTVVLWGHGETIEEAWDHAVEGFTDDPGVPNDFFTDLIEDNDIIEENDAK